MNSLTDLWDHLPSDLTLCIWSPTVGQGDTKSINEEKMAKNVMNLIK